MWDNCGIGSSNKLEQLQIEAARIVAGLPIFTKIEMFWELLSTRRNRRKLRLFYNIVNKIAPDYLCRLIPPTIQSTTLYPLRNGSNIIIPYCRLSLTTDSFIPSTIRKWNSLDNSVRNVYSLKQFKTELRNMDQHRLHIFIWTL